MRLMLSKFVGKNVPTKFAPLKFAPCRLCSRMSRFQAEAHATEVYIPKVRGKLGAGQVCGRQLVVPQDLLSQIHFTQNDVLQIRG